MKRLFVLITVLLLVTTCFTACSVKYFETAYGAARVNAAAHAFQQERVDVTLPVDNLSEGTTANASVIDDTPDAVVPAEQAPSPCLFKEESAEQASLILGEADRLSPEDVFGFVAYSLAYDLSKCGYDVYRGLAVLSDVEQVPGLLYTKYERNSMDVYTCGFLELAEGNGVLTDERVEEGLVVVADSETLKNDAFVINQFVMLGDSAGIWGDCYYECRQNGNYSMSIAVYEDDPGQYDYSLTCIDYNASRTAWTGGNVEVDTFNAISLYTADEQEAYETARQAVEDIIAIQSSNQYKAERVTLVIIETGLLETIAFDEQRGTVTTDNGVTYDIAELNSVTLGKNQILMITASDGVQVLTIPDEAEIQQALKARRTSGIIAIVGGALLALGSIALCAVTLGMSAPVTVVGLSILTGGIATTFALSNMIEGANNVRLADQGDYTTPAANPVRDALASAIGDEKTANIVYNAVGMAASIIQALLVPYASGLSIAQKVHASLGRTIFIVTRAVTVEALKLAITIGVSYFASNTVSGFVTQLTGSQTAAQWGGFIGGLVMGFLTYTDLTLLDRCYNFSGLYAKSSIGKVYSRSTRREQVLSRFNQKEWETMSLSDKKATCNQLADVIAEELGLDKKPTIKYYNNSKNGSYGSFDYRTNTLRINTYYFEEGNTVPWTEVVDTIAHELRHAKQFVNLAIDPNSEVSQSFMHYVSSSESYADYYSQPCEVDARAYAKKWAEYQLLSELRQTNVKCNYNEVVGITRDANGKIVWLEQGHLGKRASGYAHIVKEHSANFAEIGITDIPDYLLTAVSKGKIVGVQATTNATPRPIYEFLYNGDWHYVAITVGDNGYIVGANPPSASAIGGIIR